MTLNRAIYGGQVVGELPPVLVFRKSLTASQLEPFQQLAQQHVKPRAHVRGHQQRLGTHNTARLSRYKVLKEDYWPAPATAALTEHVPDLVNREAAHWLLYLGKNDFLDEQDAWVNCRTPVEFHLVALYPKQHLIVDGQLYTLSAGDAIQFAPSYRHEVPPAPQEAAWLAFMLFRDGR
ncbi:hypothetical protein NNO07_15045 [Pseudomonas resinovorans]|uniref:Cupin domain-containing protein n=1 Tax=Metapseudomonas resinovorans TaxID=53412 RepID=A0ABT4Y755_METRE|nr:hypothetical protein [Pseudomonas resinovorans]MDA8484390.1 hypothetical protein [Pseudomonas resinovorans]